MKQTLDVTIPAAVGGIAGVFRTAAKFKIFACISTTGTYQAQGGLGDVATTIDQAGRGFGSSTGKTYGQIVLTNKTNADITSTIYLGDEPLPQTLLANTINATATLSTLTLVSQQKLVLSGLLGAPVQWDAAITFSAAYVLAYKSLDGASGALNAGNVYIGASAAHQPQPLAPGNEVSIVVPANCKRRMQDWYVSADNAGDGIVIIYS